MIRYLITDGNSARDENAWLSHVSRWMERGVDFIQIREREVSARDLAVLARRVLRQRNELKLKTKILINDRADVAIACEADGIHLRDNSISAKLLARDGWTISVSCHDPSELDDSAHLILLSPIFNPLSKMEKTRPLGPEAITRAATSGVPILALGGITRANEKDCIAAGAAGIASINYFGHPGTPAGMKY